jgi:hypothetical protein
VGDPPPAGWPGGRWPGKNAGTRPPVLRRGGRPGGRTAGDWRNARPAGGGVDGLPGGGAGGSAGSVGASRGRRRKRRRGCSLAGEGGRAPRSPRGAGRRAPLHFRIAQILHAPVFFISLNPHQPPFSPSPISSATPSRTPLKKQIPSNPAFSRTKTFLWFVLVLIAFSVRHDLLGVTSLVRALCLDASNYENILHFFHSDAVNGALKLLTSKANS